VEHTHDFGGIQLKRVLVIALLTSAGAAMAASLPTALAASRSGGAKINLESTKQFGKILDDSKGWTIYAFTKDSKNKDACQNISGCTGAWPPVVTTGTPVAGTGVKQSLLGTIKLKNGKKQVTYNGHPLYTYVADGGPHMTFYVNFLQFGGRWPAVNAAGALVK
jgi:predicted lipoprotein with Yx(FWY)xxD motif